MKRKKSKQTQAPPDSGVSRRDFLRGAGVAVSGSILAGEGLLHAATEAPGEVRGPGETKVTLRINGRPKTLTIEPRVTLLDAMRDRLDMTGAKRVCDRGTCGACTVHLNGQAVYACTVLAIDAAESGADVETIESLAPDGRLHPLSAAFVENDGQQCGFCTPGFVMAGKAFLDKNPHPSYDQVKSGLGGNFCRCGTYMGVRRAVVTTGGGTGIPPREGDA
jgi:xanthine dehydrogenase YagT iron-sulfur-binding subunit